MCAANILVSLDRFYRVSSADVFQQLQEMQHSLHTHVLGRLNHFSNIPGLYEMPFPLGSS
jgi:hypothetical protein